MTTTAYSYVRFSSKKQVEGDSLRRQTQWAEDYAAKHGWVLDSTLKPDMGRSAFKGKNAVVGHLAAFLRAVEAGEVKERSVLLIESLDRLSREHVQKALALFLHILASGVDIVTREPAMHYTSKSGMADVLLALVHMERANSESEAKRLRSAEAWRHARTNGGKTTRGKVMGRTPWWELGDREENAKALRHIFNQAASGKGIELISRELNEQRFLGRLWNRSSVAMWLKDKRIAATVGRDVWSAVQTQLRIKRQCGRTSTDKVSNLFTKLIETSNGTKMQLHHLGNGTLTLIQTGARDGRNPWTSFPYQMVEDFVLMFVEKLHQGDVLTSPDTKDLEAKLEALDERIKAVASVGDVASLSEVLADLTEERKQVAESLAQLQQSAVTPSDWKATMAAMMAMDRRALKARIARIIEKIIIDTKELSGWMREAKITVVLRSGLRYEGRAKWVRRGKDRGRKLIIGQRAGKMVLVDDEHED